MSLAVTHRSSGDLRADRRYAYAEAALKEGDAAAAADLMQQTVEIVPGWVPAWILLGTARLALSDRAGAAAALREALRLDPTDVLGAGPRLARLGLAPVQGAMTDAYVRALFDDYAGRFDAHLTRDLAYRGPALLLQAVDRAAAATTGRGLRFARVLDLGCGTGLMGEAVRARAEHLAGCDLSPVMVEKARAKRVYDALAVADLLTFLSAEEEVSADLLLAADVLVYVGELAAIFAAAARVLQHRGLFAFTVQAPGAGGEEAFELGEDMRYAHGSGYLRARAAAAGLAVLSLESAATRLDRGAPVPGHVVVLTRSS
ncbi:methyltransferase domain-containing protein [Chelatococcus sp. SYSU_G07232]|uniref:Methyltransferase domain-containing protein n=1 Tax=Chelatococcus albus TaxID=3047466 RepID=A0ABT7AF43_9HYPH|nr:methyltransferase domain-containing protein [Chelatococcus sp. SYSU_G07232]MDJ1157986.1 methyltransferase domain-containing protein [Chelatococcus sp. SYSU_G07232]